MSCRWSFGGRLARNASLRDSRCRKPYVFPYKVRPRTSMIYLCGGSDLLADFLHFGASDFPSKNPFKKCFKIVFFFALASRSGFGATISDAIARSSIVFCNSVSADRIGMAASRLLLALAACVMSLAAGSRKSYWSGCMKAATVIC